MLASSDCENLYSTYGTQRRSKRTIVNSFCTAVTTNEMSTIEFHRSSFYLANHAPLGIDCDLSATFCRAELQHDCFMIAY